MSSPTTPNTRLEYCNWTFVDCLEKSIKWRVVRDCEPADDWEDDNQGFILTRGDSRNWKAYQASLQPQTQTRYPRPLAGAQCPKCGKQVNGVNPYDDGETWRK